MASNTLLTKTEITRRAVRSLHNNLAASRNVNKQYDDRFATTEKIGKTLQIRMPNRYEVTEGATLNVQDTVEEQVTLTVATQNHVGMNFTTADLTMDIDDFAERIIDPAMLKLASHVDFNLLQHAYRNTYNQVGTPGTTPASSLVWLQGGQKLDEFAAPRDNNRSAIMNPAAQASTVDALKGLFQASDKIAAQYNSGMMGRGLGLDFNMSQNINAHTNGTFAGTVLINEPGGVAEGDTTIGMDAFTAAAPALKEGDSYTVVGVNAVNPETGQDTGSLQQFVVRADVTGSSNAATLTISPVMRSTGARKTITALPADGAAVTFIGTEAVPYPQNMVWHKDAHTMVTADLQLPQGVDFAAREVKDGISLRMVRQYDINNDTIPTRIDVYYGFASPRPEHSCRVTG